MITRRLLLAERDAARAEVRVREAQATTAARTQELEKVRETNEALLADVHALRNELAHLYQSTSWRWSLPLRAASLAMQRIRGGQGGPALRAPLSADLTLFEPEPVVTLSPREHALLQRLRRG